MGGIYRVVNADGSVSFTDTPNGSGKFEAMGSDGRARASNDSGYDHKQVTGLIKEAQKRIPKVIDYLEYIQYLRDHGRFWRLERALQQLQKEDPALWLKLQKYPQFRPLRNTALGLSAADKHIAAGLGFATGNATGSAEKWLESTVKEMMKRDRYGPYADVLGTKASTLPASKAPSYSSSRLGQYLKAEEPRAAQAAKAAAKELEGSRAAVRGNVATAISRPGSALIDLGLAALNPEVHSGVTNFVIETKLKKGWSSGALTDEQYTTAHNLMANGQIKEMLSYLQSLR